VVARREPIDGAAGTVDAGMYGFLLRPKWIGFHLLVIGAVVLMVNLGFWQLRRLDQRREFNAAVESRADMPVRRLDDVLAESNDDDYGDIEWRPVEVTGTYVPDEQIVVVNRSQRGAAGDNTVTPLRQDDGTIVLVTRGFVPLGSEGAPAPEGEVTVTGLVRPSQVHRRGQLSDPAEGDLETVHRIDIDRLAPQLPGPVEPVSIDLVTSDPPQEGTLPDPVLRPELGEGPHLSYAMQWFTFSIAVVVGWVLAVRRSAARRRHDAARADGADAVSPGPDEPAPPAEAAPAGDEAAPAPR